MMKIRFNNANGEEVTREFASIEEVRVRANDLNAMLVDASVSKEAAIEADLELFAVEGALDDARRAKLAIHKPTSFEPSDYEVVDYLDNQPPKFYPPGFLCPPHILEAAYAQFRAEREAWINNINRLFPNRHETGISTHQCTHCGCRNVRYIVAVLHKPTGLNVVFGSDCVERLGFANASAFRAAQIKARAEAGHARMKIIAARARFIAEHPEIKTALEQINNPVHARNNFAKDVLGKLNQYGSLSPRQVEAVVQSLARDVEYAAKKAAEPAEVKGTLPVGKRQEFTGSIVSSKWQENDFGGCTKILVKLDNNCKIWMTAPAALGEPVKGNRYTFRATVEASKEDPHFGFGSRPNVVKDLNPAPVAQAA